MTRGGNVARAGSRDGLGQRDGLVLSGGGARVSFQLGALRYLYDVVEIQPRIITGTSAGAVLATVLAQAPDTAGQRAYLAQLEEIWWRMPDSSAIFTELPWFASLRRRGPSVVDAVARRRRRQGTLGRSFQRVAQLGHELSTLTSARFAAPGGRAARRRGVGKLGAHGLRRPTTWRASNRAQQSGPAEVSSQAEAAAVAATHSAADVTPETAELLDDTAEAPGAAGQERPVWHWAAALEMVRALLGVGGELPDIIAGARRERSMFEPGPEIEGMLTSGIFDPARVTSSGNVLRIAVVALESGELRYVTEDGSIVDRDDEPLPAEPKVELATAVRASSAIPMVFPPVRLGSENYVDGGIRESLPAEIAQRFLAADPCYAVLAGPTRGVAREDSFDEGSMLAVALRTSTVIMADEIQRDEARSARYDGALVIEPEFDVHTTLTITPGLVAISIDYGYLRAAEAHEGAAPGEQQTTRRIIELRRDAWRLEEQLFASEGHDESSGHCDSTNGSTAPGTCDTNPGAREQLATIKTSLRDLVAEVPTSRLPDGAEQWWPGWEQHCFDIDESPWW